MRVHPDTYLTRLAAFTTYDGKDMPQSREWDDRTTPRTDKPVRFDYFYAPAPKIWKRSTSGRYWSQVA